MRNTKSPTLRRVASSLPRANAARLTASVCLLLLSFLSIAQSPTQNAVPAARQARNVAVITIRSNEMIDGLTADSFARRLRLAERAGADAIVVDLDTPGGQLPAVLAITSLLKGSRIPNTVAWINPTAYSGGAIIALACREIVAAPSAAIGDALPVTFDASGQMKVVSGANLKKVLPPLMADLTDSARRFGRDEYLLQAIATDSVELWLIQETATGRRMCIDAAEYRTLFGEDPPRGLPRLSSTSPSAPPSTPAPAPRKPPAPGDTSPLPGAAQDSEAPASDPPAGPDYRPASPRLGRVAQEVNERLEMTSSERSARPTLSAADRGGWKLVTYVCNGTGPIVFKHDDLAYFRMSAATIRNDEELKAFFGAKHLIRLDPSWSEGLVWFLTLRPIQGGLMIIFLLALFVEMTHPGVMLPGAVALIAMVGLLAPPLLIDLANWWEIAAILGGILLVVLEIFVLPGFGVAGVLGLVLLFGGLVGTFIPAGGFFPDSEQQRHDLIYGLATMALSVATAGAGMYFFARNVQSLPLFNRLVLKDAGPLEGEGRDEFLAAMGGSTTSIKKGMTGVAVTPLRPAGRVELDGLQGRIIDVVAEIGYIPPGARVRIVSVSDFRIAVETADPGSPGVSRA